MFIYYTVKKINSVYKPILYKSQIIKNNMTKLKTQVIIQFISTLKNLTNQKLEDKIFLFKQNQSDNMHDERSVILYKMTNEMCELEYSPFSNSLYGDLEELDEGTQQVIKYLLENKINQVYTIDENLKSFQTNFFNLKYENQQPTKETLGIKSQTMPLGHSLECTFLGNEISDRDIVIYNLNQAKLKVTPISEIK